MKRILIINGPNLNLLGKREPNIYGSTTLYDVETSVKKKFPNVQIEFYQSNVEGELINAIQQGMSGAFDGIVLNAGGYTHTSVAVRDAVAALKIPVIEVHISNVYAREEFRKQSLIAPVCQGSIVGLGAKGYELAVEALVENAS
ncbi:MAG: type II 3-dehydroquinate dehydratase [Ignavibacteriales bacterium]|nr:type II 3-dehydroquinate dehydratase [Ignavibacteriales bacterium]